MTKSKKFLNSVILTILISMLLLLVFIPLNNTKYVAYAADIGDVTVTSYSYQSSNIFVPTKRTYPNSDASTHIDYLVFKILVSTNGTNPSASDYIKVDYDFSLFFAANTSASQKNNYFYLPSFYNTSSYVPASNTIVKAYNGESWYQFITYRTAGFNANVSKIVFTNTYKSSNADGFNEIYFYTPTDDYLLFRFYIPVDDPSAYFTPRTYYIGSYDAEDSNYQFGYNNGYTFGYEDGVSSGYNDGFNVGKSDGYSLGYNDGVNNAGTYSFSSLLGAIIDVPVNAFTSLLNFELLGINLFGFICGLLTFALVIFIIKLCMGGK